jgi:hypothetical protein
VLPDVVILQLIEWIKGARTKRMPHTRVFFSNRRGIGENLGAMVFPHIFRLTTYIFSINVIHGRVEHTSELNTVDHIVKAINYSIIS